MTRPRRSAAMAANASTSSEEENPRRSARSRSQTKFFTDSDDKMDVDSSSDAEESEDDMMEEEEAAMPTRKSSRSTAFRGEMKDPSNSIADLLKIADAAADSNMARSKRTKRRSTLEDTPSGESDDEDSVSKQRSSTRSRPLKSPAKRHTRKRMSKAPEHHSESSDAESEHESEEDESEEEEEEMKFSKIIASKSLTLKEWQEVSSKINTTEITNGSRWIQEDIPVDNLDRYEERFLVKWNDLSHLHCSWETEKDLVEFCDGAKGRLSTFFRKSVGGLLYDADERLDGDYFDPSWITIERILNCDTDEENVNEKEKDPVKRYNIILDPKHPDFEQGTGRQLHVKWVNKNYSETSWEFERDLILNEVEYLEQLAAFEMRKEKPTREEMKEREDIGKTEMKRLCKVFSEKVKATEEEREKLIKKYQKDLEEKEFKNGGQLRDYQAEGVSWLMSNHINKRSSILADEMGLGKTIQTATYVSTVASQLSTRGPFLIVAPLSTIPHWYREFTGWTDLNTIVYHGSAEDRARCRSDEFPFPKDYIDPDNLGFNARYLNKVQKKWRANWMRTWMVEVVITTPEMLVTDDFKELASIEWEILVVDEAHRLKNHNSKLAKNLRDENFEFKHSLLLTGTPIQNNMEELWTLLHFINPDGFDSLDDFIDQYGDMKSKERVDELHETIRPYILRRLKEDVEKSVPPKEETLIEVELTTLQKQYYRALYEKNLKFLHKNKKKHIDGPSINNLAMQLRKCCNHPFLLNGVESEVRSQQPNTTTLDLLVNASGKFVLLDKLLPRLKADGHRILLFSQFKIMLDIIEDYLHLRDFKCERIDGSITGLKRQAAIDRFQSKKGTESGREPPLIMLLSTRAGGVGINLTAADTCIIFDSDWNPQNDLQAQARCHRIGQTKNVKIYRLLTRKTYEMQMFHMSSMKMGLDQAVLQGIENTGGDKDVMTKEEVEKLLKNGAYDIFREDKDGSGDKESSDFLAQDIDSILERRAKTIVHENTGSKSSAAGGTFSKASFKGNANEAEVDIDDPDFWTKVVGEVKDDEDTGILASGKKRKRERTNYSEKEMLKDFDLAIDGHFAEEDNDNNSVASDYSDAGGDDSSEEDAIQYLSEDLKQIVQDVKNTRTKKDERHSWGGAGPTQWSKYDVELLLKTMQAFGYGNISWDDFFKKSMPFSKSYKPEELRRMCWSLALMCFQEAAQDKINEVAASEAKSSDGDVLSRIGENDSVKESETDEKRSKELAKKKHEAFLKVLDTNKSWLSQVIDDALAYSKSTEPRDKELVKRILSGSHSPQKTPRENPAQTQLSIQFEEQVWPSLRSRGWKVEVKPGNARKLYSHGGQNYASIAAVLSAIPNSHPELMNNVNSLISSVRALCKDDDAASTQQHEFDPENMTASSLKDFINLFAPIQLVVDRNRGSRINLHHNTTVGRMNLLKTLHSAVKLAEKNLPADASNDDRDKALSKLIKIGSKSSLPHPQWTRTHDAILVRAVKKHGWLDRPAIRNAIVSDPSIKWGHPFEAASIQNDKSNKLEANSVIENASDEEYLKVLSAARRAIAFLVIDLGEGLTPAILNELQEKLSKAYCLSQEEGDESASPQWKVDENHLKTLVLMEKASSEDCDDLPNKKLLSKRLKKLVAAFSDSADLAVEETEEAPQNNDEQTSSFPENYGFAIIDQTVRCNILLAEMVKVLLKFTKKSNKQKEFAQLIMSEIDSRVDDMSNSSEAGGSLAAMRKLKEHIAMYQDNCKASARPAKNVLRVILGIDPVDAKTGNEGLFPMSEEQKSIAKLAKAAHQKLKKNSETPADRIMNRALEAVARDEDGTSSDNLRLTSLEILILTVLTSQGLPVYCDDWSKIIEIDIMEDETAGADFKIYFSVMTGVLKAAADVWVNVTKRKLEQKVRELLTMDEDDSARSNIADEISILQRDHDYKKDAYSEAAKFCNQPLMLAKKAVTLLEALRKNIGPVDTNYAGEKRTRALNKSENGLGTKALSWFAKELNRWGQTLGVVDRSGNVKGETSISSTKNHPQSHDAAFLTKKDCRTVYNQVVQQTRLRSIFIKNSEEKMKGLIPKALKQSTTEWGNQPSWWNSVNDDDYDLLAAILDYGYGGFDELVDANIPFCNKLKEEADASGEANAICRPVAQLRINHLTRDLHSIDESEENMKLVARNKARRESGQSTGSSTGKKTKSGGVQVALHAFFNKRPSNGEPSAAKRQKTPPTSPDHSVEPEVITID